MGGVLTALAGLAAGTVHVLSGPDHLAAVAPLAADARRAQWRTGLAWGLGHTTGVLLVGTGALLLRDLLPIDAVASWSERIVGVALVAVGLWGLRRAFGMRVHVHAHTHDGVAHAHVHVHAGTAAGGEAHLAQGHDHAHTSFAFGVLHGLAGSAHIFGILPALALPTRAASFAYLASYGVGTIAAMTAFSSIVGLLGARARHGGVRAIRGLLYTCSSAAIIVGAVWLSG
jgi:hypothetical protein